MFINYEMYEFDQIVRVKNKRARLTTNTSHQTSGWGRCEHRERTGWRLSVLTTDQEGNVPIDLRRQGH